MYRQENRRYLEQLFGRDGITCIFSNNFGQRSYDLVLADGENVERTIAPFIEKPERYFQRKVTFGSSKIRLRIGNMTLSAFTRPLVQKFRPGQAAWSTPFWLLEVRPRQWLRLHTFWNRPVLKGIVSLNDIDSIRPDLSSSATPLVMFEVVKFLNLLSADKEKRSSRGRKHTPRPLPAGDMIQSAVHITVAPKGTDGSYDAEDVCLEELAEMTPRLSASLPASDVNDGESDVFMLDDQQKEILSQHDGWLPLLSSVQLLDQLTEHRHSSRQDISYNYESDYVDASPHPPTSSSLSPLPPSSSLPSFSAPASASDFSSSLPSSSSSSSRNVVDRSSQRPLLDHRSVYIQSNPIQLNPSLSSSSSNSFYDANLSQIPHQTLQPLHSAYHVPPVLHNGPPNMNVYASAPVASSSSFVPVSVPVGPTAAVPHSPSSYFDFDLDYLF
eukprot:GILJ01010943.1.p1 GENE.GILJ01010943.1~~GILJ01010943.1.p1  ORF type:complete len:442 (-),score=53.96 GILJ01010943.1:272-1597(-)